MPPHIVQPRKLLGTRLRAHLVPWAWQDTRSFSLQLSDMRRVLMRLAFRVCVFVPLKEMLVTKRLPTHLAHKWALAVMHSRYVHTE